MANNKLYLHKNYNIKTHFRWYELLSKPGKKKPEKYRGELEVKVAFIVQSKTSSTLSLNTKSSSLLRTGSFKSIASLGAFSFLFYCK